MYSVSFAFVCVVFHGNAPLLVQAAKSVADPEGFQGVPWNPLGLGCTYVLCMNKGLEWPNERTFASNEKAH